MDIKLSFTNDGRRIPLQGWYKKVDDILRM